MSSGSTPVARFRLAERHREVLTRRYGRNNRHARESRGARQAATGRRGAKPPDRAQGDSPAAVDRGHAGGRRAVRHTPCRGAPALTDSSPTVSLPRRLTASISRTLARPGRQQRKPYRFGPCEDRIATAQPLIAVLGVINGQLVQNGSNARHRPHRRERSVVLLERGRPTGELHLAPPRMDGDP